MSAVDVIIIGKGLFGSAAARHLAVAGARVLVIGPDEPAGSAVPAVYASHYDQGRLVLGSHRDAIWSTLSRRSVNAYPGIAMESGIAFHEPRGALLAAAPGQSHARLANLPAFSRRFGLQARFDDPALAADFPAYTFPAGSRVGFEGPPAGFINPRSLIRAQLACAVSAGARVVPAVARDVSVARSGVQVTVTDGRTFVADRVLVAAGAYTNTPGLVPWPLALRVKSETILLGRVDEAQAHALGAAPVVTYAINSPLLEGIYLVPPVRYPDDHFYIKMGCNTTSDRWLRDRDEMNEWVRAGDSRVHEGAMRAALEALMPGLVLDGVQTGRCLVTYTPQDKPYVDALIPDRLFVAAGGNGTGAHLSDAVGALAARIVMRGAWDDGELDPMPFRVRTVAEAGWDAYVRFRQPAA